MAEFVKKTENRTLIGEVISDKMDKSIVVKVTKTLRHPFLGKVIRSAKKYTVHDEKNEARIGDSVEIKESRPISKMKHMQLVRVLGKN